MARYFNRKSKLTKIISLVLAGLVLFGAVAGIVAITKQKTETISPLSFHVGEIDKNGEQQESKTAVYSDAFGCIGLKVEPKFDSHGTYDIFYYDYLGNFLVAKTGLIKAYDETYPLAKTARVVYHPDIPEDVNARDFEIKWYEVASYASNLVITVDKDQYFRYEESGNLVMEENIVTNKTYENISENPYTINVNNFTDGNGWLVKPITIEESYDKVDVFLKVNQKDAGFVFILSADENGKVVSVRSVDTRVENGFVEGTWDCYSFDFEKTNASQIVVFSSYAGINADVQIYAYND